MNGPAVRTAKSRSDWIHYQLRPMEPRDGAAYADLMASSPEQGLIAIQVIYKLDPYEMLMQRRIAQMEILCIEGIAGVVRSRGQRGRWQSRYIMSDIKVGGVPTGRGDQEWRGRVDRSADDARTRVPKESEG